MRKRYIIAIVLGVLLLILLSAANTYLALRNDDREATERLVAAYTSDTIKATQRLIDERISQIEQIPGQDGRDGRDGTNGIGLPGAPGQPGQNGSDGRDGAEGDKGNPGDQGEPGVPGREIELRHDSKTNTLQWRYIGDDLWTVLVEGCKITNSCKEE